MKEFFLSTWNAGRWATDGCLLQFMPTQQWVSVKALRLLCSTLSAHPPAPMSQSCTHCLTPLVPITGPARSGCLHKVWQFFLTQHIKGPYPTGQQYTLSEANLQLGLSSSVSTCAPFIPSVNIKYTSEQPLLSLLYLPGRRRIYLAASAIDLTHYLRVRLAFLFHTWFLITVIMQSQWRCNLWDAAFSWSSASSESGVANMNISHLALPNSFIYSSLVITFPSRVDLIFISVSPGTSTKCCRSNTERKMLDNQTICLILASFSILPYL